MKRDSDRLGREVKFGRVFSLLKEFSIAVRANRKYSFTKGCVDHKVRWCANALSIRSVIIKAGFIESGVLEGFYKFTEMGEDMKMSEMANILIDKIDGNKEHLSDYVPDLDKSILKEPMSEEEEHENKINEFKKANKPELISGPFMGELHPVAQTDEIRSISKSDLIAFLQKTILDYEKTIHHLRQTISLFENN